MANATAPAYLQPLAGEVPLKLVLRYVDMDQPLSDFAIGYVACQLVAAYGNEAMRLAARQVLERITQPDPTELANWCRVISALEEQAVVNQIVKIRRSCPDIQVAIAEHRSSNLPRGCCS